jgi:methyl-accepting chemotaxis protein
MVERLKNVKIKVKLMGGFGMILALLVIVISLYQFNLTSTVSDFRNLLTGEMAISLHTKEIWALMLEGRRNERKYLAGEGNEYLNQLRDNLSTLQERARDIINLVDGKDNKALKDVVLSIISSAQDYEQAFNKMVKEQEIRGMVQDSGLQGKFKGIAQIFTADMLGHQVDDLQIAVLQMRRSEEEFARVRGDEAEKNFMAAMGTYRVLLEKSSCNAVAKKAQEEALEKYHAAAVKLTEASAAIDQKKQRQAMDQYGRLIEDTLQSVYVPEAQTLFLTIRNNEQEYLLTGDEKYAQAAKASIATLLDAFKKSGILKEHREDTEKITAEYQEAFDALVAEDRVVASLLVQMRDAVSKVESGVHEITESTNTLVDKEIKRTMSSAKTFSRIGMASGIGAVVFGLLLSFLITRAITTPLAETLNFAHKLADGDLASRMEVVCDDEIGKLGRALNISSENLSSMIRVIKEKSTTLATAASQLSSVSLQLKENSEIVSKQSNTVNESAESLSVNINTMAGAAEEMSVNIGSVSGGAEGMSLDMNTVAAAIEQMATSIKEVADNATDASDVSGTAMERSKVASGTMNTLGNAAFEIGKVTEVIKRIAEQTNLLALNATIEAASAGEAGKGFAVVAHEIKELASQSAQAAEDIAAKIRGVQDNTQEAVKVISSVSEIINSINYSVADIARSVKEQNSTANEIAETVGRTKKATDDVASAIAEISLGANDMSESIGDSATRASEVTKIIDGVKHVIADANEGATQVNDSAGQLSEMAADMLKMVERFKV